MYLGLLIEMAKMERTCQEKGKMARAKKNGSKVHQCQERDGNVELQVDDVFRKLLERTTRKRETQSPILPPWHGW